MTSILVLDSGLGGLSVFRKVVEARPDASYLYVADDVFFPYDSRSESELIERIPALVGDLVAEHTPDLVVIACNTASTLVLPELRSRYSVPFVGIVPAIKPACAGSKTRLVSVIGTEATVKREYTRALIRDFADGCEVNLVGSHSLAGIAEAALRGEPIDDETIRREIAPCFVEIGDRRTDIVVLACTHYPLLIERLERLAPWPVEWLDPAPAIAARVVSLIGPPRHERLGARRAIFTSGEQAPDAVTRALAGFGLETPA